MSQTVKATILLGVPKEAVSTTTTSLSPPTTPVHISNFAHQLSNHPVQQFSSDPILSEHFQQDSSMHYYIILL